MKSIVLYRSDASDVDLAAALGTPRSTIASWRRRGSISLEHLLYITGNRGVSMEWLVYGRGNWWNDDLKVNGIPLILDLLGMIIKDIYLSSEKSGFEPHEGISENPEAHASYIYNSYSNLYRDIYDAAKTLGRETSDIIREMRIRRGLTPETDRRGFLKASVFREEGPQ
jgi:hypothetical protein